MADDQRGSVFAGPYQDQISKLRAMRTILADFGRSLSMDLVADDAKAVDTQRNSRE